MELSGELQSLKRLLSSDAMLGMCGRVSRQQKGERIKKATRENERKRGRSAGRSRVAGGLYHDPRMVVD